MPSIYFADEMSWTPFDAKNREQSLTSIFFDEAPSPQNADIIVSRRLADLTPFFKLKKRCHIWTHEPFWLPVSDKFLFDQSTGKRISVSSAFNGDIYISPLFYFPFLNLDLDKIISMARQKTHDCVFLATYRKKSDRYIGRVNVDLSAYRQNLAISLSERNVCHIYGNSWPAEVSTLAESRGVGWHTKKLQIIGGYRFNLACENTIARNYVTEKFWDAFQGACIPIYFAAGTGIDQVSDLRSFVDCSNGATPEDISGVIRGLSSTDIEEMLAIGTHKFNEISASTSRQEIQRQYLDRFRERVLEEMSM